MTVRRMESADLEQVAALEQAAFTDPWSFNIWKDCLEGRRDICYVAEQDGLIVGYFCMMVVLDEAELLKIAVLPEKQKKGVASGLMEMMLCYLGSRKICAVTLEVREHNRAALALYTKYGFVPEGRRKNYYRNPAEDAIIMRKSQL